MALFLLQSIYLKPVWVPDPDAQPGQFSMKKLSDDALIQVIKNDETNTSEIRIIERPTIEFYTVRDEANCKPFNEICIDASKVETHTVEYSKREFEMCKYLGIETEYRQLKQAANRRYPTWEMAQKARNEFRDFMNKKVYMSPYIYGASTTIEEFYKSKFMMENGSRPPRTFNMSYYDIETYIYKYNEKVDQNRPIAPINVITYYNTKYNHFYCLVLEIDEIPAIQEVKNNLQEYIREYILEDFEDIPDVKLHFEFYDSEIMLMRRFMNLIHLDKPDVALAWNDNYDKKYIIGRMKHYNLDVSQEWCHPDIPDQYKQFSFIEDKARSETSFTKKADGSKGTDYSRLWDKTICPGYTLFIDQMSLYANLRKRRTERSYKLGDIAEFEVNATKVNLHDFGLNIRNAPFKDFKRFLKYSCKDTKLLYMIENKNRDIGNFILKCGNSDVWDGVRVSIIIKNAYMFRMLNENKIIGNTVDYGVVEAIDGALVQKTELVDVPPVEIEGKKTMIFRNVVDFDAKSLYPSLMNQGKIGKENQKYRIMQIVDVDNKYLMSGNEFNQLLQTKDVSIVDLCETLYGLPSVTEVLANLQNYLEEKLCG